MSLEQSMAIKEVFIGLVSRYSVNTKLVEDLWSEIEYKYSGKSRHYHTLDHL